MATHSSTLAWKIPWTEEPGGLLSMGSHRVRHDWSNLAAAAACDYFNPRFLIYPSLLSLSFKKKKKPPRSSWVSKTSAKKKKKKKNENCIYMILWKRQNYRNKKIQWLPGIKCGESGDQKYSRKGWWRVCSCLLYTLISAVVTRLHTCQKS